MRHRKLTMDGETDRWKEGGTDGQMERIKPFMKMYVYVRSESAIVSFSLLEHVDTVSVFLCQDRPQMTLN